MQMTIPSSCETPGLKEEVDMLHAQVGRLRQLVAELLMKNQHLREALAQTSPQLIHQELR
jgi:regulator of replication initiation timing